MRKHVLTVIVGVVVGVSLLLYMFAFQVRESEVAVLLRFGKASTDLPQPGYHFKLPWPIEEVRKFDSRINVSEGRFEETPTRDKRNITLSLCVGWRVSDPLAFNQNFGRLAEEDRMQQAWSRVEGYVRDSALAVMGQHDLNELVSVDRDKLQYDAIEDSILQAANDRANKTYGITFALLKLRRLELPESATQNVYKRMIAERNLEATKIRAGRPCERRRHQSQRDDRKGKAPGARPERSRSAQRPGRRRGGAAFRSLRQEPGAGHLSAQDPRPAGDLEDEDDHHRGPDASRRSTCSPRGSPGPSISRA